MSETLPIAGSLVPQPIKDIFKEKILSIISDLGRTITLTLKPTLQDCPNCFFNSTLQKSNNKYRSANSNPLGALNKPFLDGQRCPVCNGAGRLKSPRSIDYTATISKKFNNREILEAGIGKVTLNMVKTNTVTSSLADIEACEVALIDGKLYKPIGEAIQVGLQELILIKQFWERAQ
jgi:hypothetical protein